MPPPCHRETEAWELSAVVPQLAGDRSVTVTPALGPQRPGSYTVCWPVSSSRAGSEAESRVQRAHRAVSNTGLHL